MGNKAAKTHKTIASVSKKLSIYTFRILKKSLVAANGERITVSADICCASALLIYNSQIEF